MELLDSHASFGGEQRFYQHDSRVIGLPMRFSIYLPPEALRGASAVSLLVYLPGLTCSEETFPAKAGAHRTASELGLALLSPDTSPRGAKIPGETDSWDFGLAAGFYLDATREPWSRHYRMESYLMDELLPLVGSSLPVDAKAPGITGHSMGGHGALTLALRHPERFASVSALAPVAAPTECAWGVKALSGYLGDDRAAWARHDASRLMAARARPLVDEILIDQGLADKFLAEQLKPERFEDACARAGQRLRLRRHAGYDHSYYFVASFIEDHLRHHARALKRG